MFHLQGHADDAVGDGAGQDQGDGYGQGRKQQVKDDEPHQQPDSRIGDVGGGQDGDHVPVCVLDGKISAVAGAVGEGDLGKDFLLSHHLLQLLMGKKIGSGKA